MPCRSGADEKPLDYTTYLQVSWLLQAVIIVIYVYVHSLCDYVNDSLARSSLIFFVSHLADGNLALSLLNDSARRAPLSVFSERERVAVCHRPSVCRL